MDICLCGILFGVDTNKNSTKISQPPNCAFVVCCSCWRRHCVINITALLRCFSNKNMIFFFFLLPSRMIHGTTNCSTHWLRCWVFSWDIRPRVKSARVMWRWDELRRMQWGGQPANWPEPTWSNCSTELQHWTAALNSSSCSFIHPEEMNFTIFSKWTFPPLMKYFFFRPLFQFQYFLFHKQAHFCVRMRCNLKRNTLENRGTFPTRWCSSHILCPPPPPRCNLHQLPRISATSAKWLNCLEVIRSTFRLPGGGEGGGGRRRRSTSNQPPQNSPAVTSAKSLSLLALETNCLHVKK